MDTDVTISFLGILGAIITGFISGRYLKEKARIEGTTAPYDALAGRVVVLEAQVKKQGEEIKALRAENAIARAESEVDRAYIIDAAPWIEDHVKYAHYSPPFPPSWYRDARRKAERHGPMRAPVRPAPEPDEDTPDDEENTDDEEE